jgi:heme A synthase
VTSALDGLFGLLLLVWGIRAFPSQTKVRWGMVAVVAFLVLEGAIGALLVRLDLVAQNTSLARGWVQGLHLVNTLLLLGALTLTQGWAHGWQARSRWWREPAARSHLLWVCLLLFVGAFGAITALGDTLFPTSSLRSGLLQDFDPRSHPFLQMRVWHPVLAIITAIGMAYWAAAHLSGRLRWQVWLALLGQLLFGALNVALLAPIWLQLLHHLLADITFVTWIWAGVVFFGQSRGNRTTLEAG